METPRLNAELYPHQLDALDFALKNPYHICGLEMGLGKTLCAISLMVTTKLPTLVVCPAYLRRNWNDEIDKFSEGLDVEVVSYASLKKVKDVSRYKLIVADEAHALKNIKAKRTQLFHDIVKTSKPKHLVLATGSPIKNRVSEFWSLLQLCYYGDHYPEFKPFNRLYYKFCNTFSYERTMDLGHVTVVRFDGVRNVDQLKSLIAPVYLRRRTKDVIDLPDVVESFIKGECRKIYNENLEEAFRLFEQDASDPAYMSLKRANAVAKYKETVKFTKDLLEQDEKCVVFTDHVTSAQYIGRDLDAPVITGKVSADKRGELVSDFQDGKIDCLVATIGSLSTGVNLTAANKMIFNDLPFVPTDLAQAKARIYRIGQEKKCFYYYTINSDFDKKLKEMLDRKNKDIGKVYD